MINRDCLRQLTLTLTLTFAIAFYSNPTSADSLPNISGSLAGSLAGSFAVSETGAATYTVGLPLPPGIAGSVPAVSLTYDSASKHNGIMGPGWNLSGTSAISRCPTTIAQEGYVDPIDFDSNDRFCFDGKRLVVTSGLYGAAGSSYATENEIFAKIVANGQLGSGPQSFRIWSKDGRISDYGLSDNSRVLSKDGSSALFWMLERSEDRFGNSIVYDYSQNSETSERFLQSIKYGGNSSVGTLAQVEIRFNYQDRSDAYDEFMIGVKFKMNKRLSSVESWVEGSLVRQFRLSYTTSGDGVASGTGRSLLTQLEDCNELGECLSPTSFQYQKSSNSLNSPSIVLDENIFVNGEITGGITMSVAPYIGPEKLSLKFPDLNGDGKDDYLWMRKNPISGKPWSDYTSLPLPYDFIGALSNGTNYVPMTTAHVPFQSGGPFVLIKFPYGSSEYLGDVTGDGLVDYIWRGINWPFIGLQGVPPFMANIDGWFVAANTGSGTSTSMWQAESDPGPVFYNWAWQGVPNGSRDFFVDVNGDGRADHVWQPNALPDIYVQLSTGSSFQAPTLWLAKQSSPVNLAGDRLNEYIDLNGDNMADKVWVPNGNENLYVSLSTGTGFSAPKLWLANNTLPGIVPYSTGNGLNSNFGDINGDGLKDYIWVPNSKNTLYVALNTGEGFTFTSSEPWLSPSNVSNHTISSNAGKHQHLVDINFDGRDDWVWVPYDNASFLYVAFSLGSSFGTPKILYQYGSLDPYGELDAFADINGDGLMDRIWDPTYTGEGNIYKMTSKGTVSDLLTGVVDGYGKTTSVTYKPLTNSAVYTKASGAQYPAQEVIGPIYVVYEMQESDPNSGSNTIRFKYDGLRVSVDGRGLCGYKSITKTDLSSGITTVTKYRQDHPFKSLMYSLEKRQTSNSKLLYRETRTWNSKTLSQGRYYPYVKERLLEEFELDGSLVRTVKTATDYDDYGNVAVVQQIFGDGHSESQTNTYEIDTSNWLIGMLKSRTLTASAPNTPNLVKETSFEYEPITGVLKSETREPDKDSLKITTSYGYGLFGNVKTILVTGPTFESRAETRQYDPSGRFLVSVTNALGQSESRTFDPRHGTMTLLSGPNGVQTSWEYDAFGRKTNEYRADGTVSRWLYLSSAGVTPTPVIGTSWILREDRSDGSFEIIGYDKLGQRLYVDRLGFDGTIIRQQVQYDNLGRTLKSSEPTFMGDTEAWTSYQYDILDRVVKETGPLNKVTLIEYDGLVKTITNPLGQVTTSILNQRDWIVETIDDQGGQVENKYDAFGNPVTILDAGGDQTVITYDLYGNKLSVSEPNSGNSLFNYDALGNLISETDALNNTSITTFDLLGRMKTRIEKEGTSIWNYDIAPNGVGKLASISGPNGFSESYSYDQLGRFSSSQTTLDGEDFDFTWSYNNLGKVASIEYPSGFEIGHVYNSHGFLSEVRASATNKSVWRADSASVRSQYSQVTLGNGVVVEKDYDPVTGLLRAIDSRTSGATQLQQQTYKYNDVGNLEQRSDLLSGKVEQFDYDSLNRLTSTEVVGDYAVSIAYQPNGNIESKSDFGRYSYGENGAGPHAVTSVTTGIKTIHYSYDANGNRISSNGQRIQYTSFNRPKRIEQSGNKVTFNYGPHHALDRSVLYPLWKRTESSKNGQADKTTYFVGNLFEKVDQGLFNSKLVHHIRAGDETVAVFTSMGEPISSSTGGLFATSAAKYPQSGFYQYLLRDHIGSIEIVADQEGAIKEKFSYDPWGRRRNADWTLPSNPINAEFDHGYTGHLHIDQMELIHMGGRVYDPVSARFLSVDPLVQSPTNSQSLNRYSYVMNNPLSLTDPSGYGWLSKFFKKVKSFVNKFKAPIIAFVAAAYLGPMISGQIVGAFGLEAGQAAALAVSGATKAVISSAVSTALQGGDVGDVVSASLKSAFIAGVTAGFHADISQNFKDWAATIPEFNKEISLTITERIKSQLDGMLAHATVEAAKAGIQGGSLGVAVGSNLIGNSALWARDAFLSSQMSADQANLFWKARELMLRGAGAKTGSASDALPDWQPWQKFPNVIGLRNELTSEGASGGFNFLGEGGPISSALNLIPGANSAAIFHDYFAFALEKQGLPFVLNNSATIAPVVAANSAATLWGNY